MSGPCSVCGHPPGWRNNARHECAHVDCPNRRHAWSERPFTDDDLHEDIPALPDEQHPLDDLFDPCD